MKNKSPRNDGNLKKHITECQITKAEHWSSSFTGNCIKFNTKYNNRNEKSDKQLNQKKNKSR
jgi:hypothetical protein